MRAGIALGSNLGDRLAILQKARDRICEISGVTEPIRQSPVYETLPFDCEADAANFYNAVIEVGFDNRAETLFEALREIERALGRPHDHPSNVSRSIDLDLLYFGDRECESMQLQLPHPRLATREFVLRPLADIAPDLRLPRQTATVRELLARLQTRESVKRLTDQW